MKVNSECHLSCGGWGINYYTTVCGRTNADYWVTHNKPMVNCPKCLAIMEEAKNKVGKKK